MKKIGLVFSILIVLGIASPALADSGACSDHNGVNCSAGAGIYGQVICNDGWDGSSVSFSFTDICLNTQQPECTSQDLTSLQQKYGISQMFAEVQSLTNENNSLQQQYQSLQSYSGINSNTVNAAMDREYSPKLTEISSDISANAAQIQSEDALINQAQSEINTECEALGAQEELQQKMSAQLNQEKLDAQIQAQLESQAQAQINAINVAKQTHLNEIDTNTPNDARGSKKSTSATSSVPNFATTSSASNIPVTLTSKNLRQTFWQSFTNFFKGLFGME